MCHRQAAAARQARQRRGCRRIVAQRAAIERRRRARRAAADDQSAGVDRRQARVGVGARQCQRAAAGLRQCARSRCHAGEAIGKAHVVGNRVDDRRIAVGNLLNLTGHVLRVAARILQHAAAKGDGRCAQRTVAEVQRSAVERRRTGEAVKTIGKGQHACGSRQGETQGCTAASFRQHSCVGRTGGAFIDSQHRRSGSVRVGDRASGEAGKHPHINVNIVQVERAAVDRQGVRGSPQRRGTAGGDRARIEGGATRVAVCRVDGHHASAVLQQAGGAGDAVDTVQRVVDGAIIELDRGGGHVAIVDRDRGGATDHTRDFTQGDRSGAVTRR